MPPRGPGKCFRPSAARIMSVFPDDQAMQRRFAESLWPTGSPTVCGVPPIRLTRRINGTIANDFRGLRVCPTQAPLGAAHRGLDLPIECNL